MVKVLHNKIKQLQERAAYTNKFVVADGSVVDYKITVDDDYLLKGYAAVWNNRDTFGTAAIRGAFAKSIQERGPKSIAKYKIPLLWMHSFYEPIGHILELEEDDYGLRFVAQLDKGVKRADECAIQYRSGTLNQFSFGFDYVWDKMEYHEASNTVLMHECELFEITACTRGSNKETYAMRTPQEQNEAIAELQQRAELFIRSVPKKSKQMELRQLLAEHITLYSTKPEADPLELMGKRTLDLSIKPEDDNVVIGGYKLNKKQF